MRREGAQSLSEWVLCEAWIIVITPARVGGRRCRSYTRGSVKKLPSEARSGTECGTDRESKSGARFPTIHSESRHQRVRGNGPVAERADDDVPIESVFSPTQEASREGDTLPMKSNSRRSGQTTCHRPALHRLYRSESPESRPVRPDEEEELSSDWSTVLDWPDEEESVPDSPRVLMDRPTDRRARSEERVDRSAVEYVPEPARRPRRRSRRSSSSDELTSLSGASDCPAVNPRLLDRLPYSCPRAARRIVSTCRLRSSRTVRCWGEDIPD